MKGGTAEKGTKADVDYGLALDPKPIDILRAHRKCAVERALAAGGGLTDDGYVFTRAETPDGSKPWRPDGANSDTFIGERVPLRHKPSDYVRERVWVSCDPDERSIPPLGRALRRPVPVGVGLSHADHTPDYIPALAEMAAGFPEPSPAGVPG